MKNYDFNLPASCFILIISLSYFCDNTSSNSVISEPPVLSDFNDHYIEELPDCDLFREINQNRLIFVSTLDGVLTALDASNGMMRWIVQTGPGNLLSSSIHKLELTNNGQWVRMIPSLRGGLFQFDGNSVEPIPITADNLLSSSFKFSDDLVMSGGKEIRSYSVSLSTGKLLYECSMHGCTNHTSDQHDNPYIEDAILIRRQTQTVRAIEPRTGAERWNFSVGHNELELIRNEICHSTYILDQDTYSNIKVMVPEGIMYSVSKSSPQQIVWQYKFDYPIVNAWKTDGQNELTNIDIFSSSDDHWLQAIQDGTYQNINKLSPSVYIGMFQKQLYVQESELLRKIIHKNLLHVANRNTKFPQIPWKPYPATTSSRLLIENDSPEPGIIIQPSDNEGTLAGTALSVLYASEYVNGNGFFLYTSEDLNQSQDDLCKKEITNDNDKKEHFNLPFGEDVPVKYIVVSLWFWWKEILVIAISSTLLLNLFLSRKISRGNEIIVVERHIKVQEINEKESNYGHLESICTPSIVQTTFQSRFITDFDLVRCLGKGGFGVVFEVKNKLDDCHYAIKRIVLPNKKESRDRVMREVKTLANCEHENIVRYFQAWVETPPNGWQANQDKLLFEASSSIDIESTATESKSDSSIIYKFPQFDTKINFSTESAETSKTKFSDRGFDYTEDSLSFIVFRNNDDISATQNSKTEFQNSCAREFGDQSKCSSNSKRGNNTEDKSDSAIEYDKKSKQSKSFKPASIGTATTGCAEIKSHINNTASSRKMYLYIQMQLCRKQSLRDWLRSSDHHSREGKIINIFGQIVQAVEYVHLKGLIHRDLKPSNIFFSLDGQIKIGDFGLVTDMADLMNCGDNTGLPSCIRHTEQVGTYLYMSPEQLQGKPYNYKVDIYSLGLIFFELLVVFNTEMERIDTLKQIRNSNFPEGFHQEYSEEYKLLQLMLSPHPNERPTTFGIRANPPFNHKIDQQFHFQLDLNTLSRSRNNSVSIINST